jgi:IMP dehydrogenase/GMP reductase
MTKKTQSREYFCVAVQRDYETVWRFVSQHATREEAEAELEKRRSYTGVFNYDNAKLRVISRAEAKKEFGKDWEYVPIGGVKKKPARAELDDEI